MTAPYRSQFTNQLFATLDSLEPVSLDDHCSEYTEQVTQTLDYLDNLIEYNQVKFFGLPMNTDLKL